MGLRREKRVRERERRGESTIESEKVRRKIKNLKPCNGAFECVCVLVRECESESS